MRSAVMLRASGGCFTLSSSLFGGGLMTWLTLGAALAIFAVAERSDP